MTVRDWSMHARMEHRAKQTGVLEANQVTTTATGYAPSVSPTESAGSDLSNQCGVCGVEATEGTQWGDCWCGAWASAACAALAASAWASARVAACSERASGPGRRDDREAWRRLYVLSVLGVLSVLRFLSIVSLAMIMSRQVVIIVMRLRGSRSTGRPGLRLSVVG